MLTLGSSAETNTVTATATGLTGSPLTFNATGRLATTLAPVSGNNQTGPTCTVLANLFVVQVADAGSLPVPQVTVTFAVATGTGTLSTASAMTDSQGLASSLLTLGLTPETDTVTATTAGLSGSPVTFTATGVKKRRGQITSD